MKEDTENVFWRTCLNVALPRHFQGVLFKQNRELYVEEKDGCDLTSVSNKLLTATHSLPQHWDQGENQKVKNMWVEIKTVS